jgi:hypothetical protein
MSVYEAVTDLDRIEAPWGRQVTLQALVYQGGMAGLRLRIKEGSRFTDLELDPASAKRIARGLLDWADG